MGLMTRRASILLSVHPYPFARVPRHGLFHTRPSRRSVGFLSIFSHSLPPPSARAVSSFSLRRYVSSRRTPPRTPWNGQRSARLHVRRVRGARRVESARFNHHFSVFNGKNYYVHTCGSVVYIVGGWHSRMSQAVRRCPPPSVILLENRSQTYIVSVRPVPRPCFSHVTRPVTYSPGGPSANRATPAVPSAQTPPRTFAARSALLPRIDLPRVSPTATAVRARSASLCLSARSPGSPGRPHAAVAEHRRKSYEYTTLFRQPRGWASLQISSLSSYPATVYRHFRYVCVADTLMPATTAGAAGRGRAGGGLVMVNEQ